MKQQRLIESIIFICGIISGWLIYASVSANSGEQLAALRHSLDHSATIAQVVDGDTVRLQDGRLVRIMGIDTPELREKVDGAWRDVANPLPAAYKSRDWLAQFEGHKVRLSYGKGRVDRYKRTLAHIFVLPDGPDVADAILIRGWSKVSAIPPNTKRYRRWKNAAERSK